MAKMKREYIPVAVPVESSDPYFVDSYVRRRTVRIEFTVHEQFNEDLVPVLFRDGLRIDADSIQTVKFLNEVVTTARRKRGER